MLCVILVGLNDSFSTVLLSALALELVWRPLPSAVEVLPARRTVYCRTAVVDTWVSSGDVCADGNERERFWQSTTAATSVRSCSAGDGRTANVVEHATFNLTHTDSYAAAAAAAPAISSSRSLVIARNSIYTMSTRIEQLQSPKSTI